MKIIKINDNTDYTYRKLTEKQRLNPKFISRRLIINSYLVLLNEEFNHKII